MNEILENERERKEYKRIFALIWSGILVVIILPIISVLVSEFFTSYFNLPNIIPFPFNLITAIVVLGFGFFWAGWSNISLFKTGKGSPVPLKNTQTKLLVTNGPYKYTRNPMVFGYILIWIGLGFLFNSYIILIGFTALILIFLIIFVKFWEEKNLEERFGKPYLEYKKNVSIIFPLPPKKSSS